MEHLAIPILTDVGAGRTRQTVRAFEPMGPSMRMSQFSLARDPAIETRQASTIGCRESWNAGASPETAPPHARRIGSRQCMAVLSNVVCWLRAARSYT